jgi:hypothetical protein
MLPKTLNVSSRTKYIESLPTMGEVRSSERLDDWLSLVRSGDTDETIRRSALAQAAFRHYRHLPAARILEELERSQELFVFEKIGMVFGYIPLVRSRHNHSIFCLRMNSTGYSGRLYVSFSKDGKNESPDSPFNSPISSDTHLFEVAIFEEFDGKLIYQWKNDRSRPHDKWDDMIGSPRLWKIWEQLFRRS